MSKDIDEKTKESVGIAASVVGHCRPCFQYHFKQAKALNIPIKDLEETIELAKSIGEAGKKGMEIYAKKKKHQTRRR